MQESREAAKVCGNPVLVLVGRGDDVGSGRWVAQIDWAVHLHRLKERDEGCHVMSS
jgi:hypothetical protein